MKHESDTIESEGPPPKIFPPWAMAAVQRIGRCTMDFPILRRILAVAMKVMVMVLLVGQERQRSYCCYGVFGFTLVAPPGWSRLTHGRTFTGNYALEPHEAEVDAMVEIDHHRPSNNSSVDVTQNSTSDTSAIDYSSGDLEDVWLHVGEPETMESNLLGIKSLGVDYGLVRTGLAVTVGYEPTPLAILSDFNTTDRHDITSRTRLCDAIVAAASAHAVSRIILGLPYHKNGTVALQTLRTVEFGLHLQYTVLRHLGPSVPVWLFDERYTSKDAARRLHARDARQSLYGNLDAAAAAILLENYYADGSVGARRMVALPETVRAACLAEYSERLRVQHEQLELERVARLARLERRRQSSSSLAVSLDHREHGNDTNRSAESGSLASKRKRKKKR
jgi:putative holliday junction resolvase